MTDQDNQNDQDWLDALSGRPREGADALELAQAAAVRRALIERRNTIEADIRVSSEDQFQKLRARLQAEGLLKEPKVPRHSIATNFINWLGTFGERTSNGGVAWQRWGAVALVVLGVTTVVQLGVTLSNSESEVDLMRGGTATVLIVDDVNASLIQLRAGLDSANAKYTVKQLSNGRLEIDVQSDAAAIGYLESHRIEPIVKDNSMRIIIQPKKTG